MTTKGQYQSEVLGAIHETMNALFEIGAINKVTMREFDELCLDPVVELQPEEIRALRKRENVSQLNRWKVGERTHLPEVSPRFTWILMGGARVN